MRTLRSSSIAAILGLLLLTHTCSAAAAPHQAVLTYGASSDAGATYTVKRSTTPGGPYTVVKTGITTLTFTDTPLTAATQFCWIVTATAPGKDESAPTNEACGTSKRDQTGSPGSLAVVVQ